MSVYILPQQMLPATELRATMTGSNVQIGILLQYPVKLVLDNQSSVAVELLIDVGGVGNLISWKTFTANEALVLDGDIYSFPTGTIFYGNGASGDFSISYTYIKQP